MEGIEICYAAVDSVLYVQVQRCRCESLMEANCPRMAERFSVLTGEPLKEEQQLGRLIKFIHVAIKNNTLLVFCTLYKMSHARHICAIYV